jgi:hypothetical protein
MVWIIQKSVKESKYLTETGHWFSLPCLNLVHCTSKTAARKVIADLPALVDRVRAFAVILLEENKS